MDEHTVIGDIDLLIENACVPVACCASQRVDAMLAEHRASIGEMDRLVTGLLGSRHQASEEVLPLMVSNAPTR